MSDQHINAERIRITLNTTSAIAAHLGIVLDQDGDTVVLPDVEPLRATVARVLYARHARSDLTRWDYESAATHDWWKMHADAAIDAAPTSTTLDLARRIHARVGIGPWGRLTSSAAAHYLITAEHVARILTQRTRRDLERAQAEAFRAKVCPVCGAERLTARCVREQHGVVETGA